MKRLLMLMIAVLSLCAFSAYAQSKSQLTEEQKTRIFTAKVKMMQGRLSLSADQLVKFIPIYKNYYAAMEMAFQGRRHCKDKDVATTAEACKIIDAQLTGKLEVIKIQKRFIPQFSRVLTPQQLMRFLQVENKIQREIMIEYKRRKNA